MKDKENEFRLFMACDLETYTTDRLQLSQQFADFAVVEAVALFVAVEESFVAAVEVANVEASKHLLAYLAVGCLLLEPQLPYLS